MTCELPILFAGDMVRAILRGDKTQTRRPVRPQPPFGAPLDGDPYRSPFGRPGDLLYVRESFAPNYFGPGRHGFAADWTDAAADVVPRPRWRPSIHMPKAAARIWLRVEEVRVERVRDITEADARAEGVEPSTAVGASTAWGGPHRWAFMRLFDSIYDYGVISTNANPWVWAVRFEVLSTTGRPA